MRRVFIKPFYSIKITEIRINKKKHPRALLKKKFKYNIKFFLYNYKFNF